MKVYITKYALTRGILEAEAVMRVNGVEVDGQLFRDGDWLYERKYAVERAEEMREAKVKALLKKIERLQKMRFT